MLKSDVPEFTRPMYSSMIFGLFPAAWMIVGDSMSSGMVHPFSVEITRSKSETAAVHRLSRIACHRSDIGEALTGDTRQVFPSDGEEATLLGSLFRLGFFSLHRLQNVMGFPTIRETLSGNGKRRENALRQHTRLDVLRARFLPVQLSVGAAKPFSRREMALVERDGPGNERSHRGKLF
jgi:hypothetical protein